MKLEELNGEQIDTWYAYVLEHGQKRRLGESKLETIRRYFGDEVPEPQDGARPAPTKRPLANTDG